MNEAKETQYITITREEYDKMKTAVNCLMLLFNTPMVYQDATIKAAKQAIYGITDEGVPDNDPGAASE